MLSPGIAHLLPAPHPVAARARAWRVPILSDAELLCLAIAQVLLDFPRERHWTRYARRHLRHRLCCIKSPMTLSRRPCRA